MNGLRLVTMVLVVTDVVDAADLAGVVVAELTLGAEALPVRNAPSRTNNG